MALDPMVTSAIIGGVGSLASNTASGIFGYNQAAKNRAFQERMYERQLNDMRENWERQNEYDLPSAQMQRLRDANLNPYLMYSNGASGLTSQGSIGNPSQPHGAQAQVQFTNPAMDALNARAMEATIEKTQAETQKTVSETDWQNIENKFSKESYNIRMAIKYGDYDMLNTTMDKMRADIYNGKQITTQQVLSMMQGREYEVKRFDLDKWSLGEQIAQGWENVVTGKTQASAQVRNSFAAMMNAKNAWRLGDWQIGQIALNMYQSSEMFPLLMEGQRQDNVNKFWDRILKGVEIDNKRKEGFKTDIENYFREHGVGPESWWYKAAGPFVLPTIHANDKWFKKDYVPTGYKR